MEPAKDRDIKEHMLNSGRHLKKRKPSPTLSIYIWSQIITTRLLFPESTE